MSTYTRAATARHRCLRARPRGPGPRALRGVLRRAAGAAGGRALGRARGVLGDGRRPHADRAVAAAGRAGGRARRRPRPLRDAHRRGRLRCGGGAAARGGVPGTGARVRDHPRAGGVPDRSRRPRRRAVDLGRGGAPVTRGLGSALGIVISVVCLAAVVWWALQQDPPQLPHTPAELSALVSAIALYGVNTLVRSERWHRLLRDDGARPARVDSYSLTTVGYAVNNVLPARAGDAARVVLMAPRADASKRTVIGTIVAERLLDVGVILVLFLVVGYAILGNVGGDSVEWIVLATVAVLAAGAVAIVLVRRNRRIHEFVAPMLSSTRRLLGRDGLPLVAMTFVVWIIEACAWIAVGASVGFGMSFLEGLYLVALASVFALIPSGPGYAGTQDAATVIGIKAIGGTGATAVSYLVMLRFALLVPITAVGFVLLAARYGGLARLRAARAT